MQRYLIAYSGTTNFDKATRLFRNRNGQRIADGTWVVESTEPTPCKFIRSLPAEFRQGFEIVLCRRYTGSNTHIAA